MSTQNKFFDEQTETILVSKHGLMTRIRNLVELDTEVHVVSTKNDTAGTFNVVWVNTQDHDGFHQLGLEVIESEGDMWGIRFPDLQTPTDEATAQAWLECTRCHQKQLGTVPQAEVEHLDMGVLVARPCDKCKATTPWAFTAEAETSPFPSEVAQIPPGMLMAPYENFQAPPAPGSAASRQPGADLRTRTRAPLKLSVKVIREAYGTSIEDVGETINVSRNGAYFLTAQNYHVGEIIKIVLPYRKGDLALPVAAKVIRQDQPKGTFNHAVAVHMEQAVSLAELGKPSEAASVAEKKVDQRSRSRVPLKMAIKITREKYGTEVEDFGETINISREGAYFQTSQNYDIGETLQVVMPYKKGEMTIPVSAQVIRQDKAKGSFRNAVAIFMGGRKK